MRRYKQKVKKDDILNGKKSGKLTAIRLWGKRKSGALKALFRCDCGNYIVNNISNVRKEKSQSCGHCGTCIDDLGDYLEDSKYYRLYTGWRLLRYRCNNMMNDHYANYGGRGIKVCDEWDNSYSAFKKWVLDNGYILGLSKKEQSLDRINVDGDYEPNNCRWVNAEVQTRNRRNMIETVFNGEKVLLVELAERYNIRYDAVYQRYCKGVRGDDLIKPLFKAPTYEVEGCTLTIKELSEKYNISRTAILNRINKGLYGLDLVTKKKRGGRKHE